MTRTEAKPQPIFTVPDSQIGGDGGFLVLTRKQGEDLIIELDGHTILVRCMDMTPGRIRYGIKAPKKAKVHRREVWDRIQAQEAEHGKSH